MFQGWEVQTLKIQTMDFSFKKFFIKNDLVCTYYISLVEVIFRHQKLRLKLRSSYTAF